MPDIFNTQYIRLLEKEFVSVSIADGDYIFKVAEYAPRNNLIEYFIFTDGAGDPIDATGGSVNITFSPGYDKYQTISMGQFDAVDAQLASREKPNGYGKVEKVKINLSGITGPAVGFVSLLSQSVT